MSLIVIMTLAYAGFYFLPSETHVIQLEESSSLWTVSLTEEPLPCPTELYASNGY